MTGLENLYTNPLPELKGKRLGLLANPASVTSDFIHASDIIEAIYPGQLKVLFSPQHGFHAEKQDNMIESDHCIDSKHQIPIFSLYSDTRVPKREMFDRIDILLIDLQDVGTRVYTFIYTISYCIEAAGKYNKKVIILDRPNPVSGKIIEGNILKKNLISFVGRFPIPMRHGFTVGEIASFFNHLPNAFEFFSSTFDPADNTFEGSSNGSKSHNDKDGVDFRSDLKPTCDLDIIPMKGWKRDMLFTDTGLPWIAPSPNLPTPASALVYPGQVIWEGTNISEGRGTTQPFELFGAPFIETEKLIEAVQPFIKGAILRPVAFEPTSGKWQKNVCRGFQIHVTSPEEYKAYFTSLLILQQIIRLYPDDFKWKQPPYEYEYNKLPIDLILGDTELRRKIEQTANDNMKGIDSIERSWKTELDNFHTISRNFYLYA
nr:DUF1343 domain-containing protein [Desulfamplus magnetovallimortis]